MGVMGVMERSKLFVPVVHRLRETDRTDREMGRDGEIQVHRPAVHRPGEGDREVTGRRGRTSRWERRPCCSDTVQALSRLLRVPTPLLASPASCGPTMHDPRPPPTPSVLTGTMSRPEKRQGARWVGCPT